MQPSDRRLAAAARAALAATLLFTVSCSDSTSPPTPAAIVVTGDDGLGFVGIVGQAITPGPQIQINDSKGSPLGGVSFTVTVTGGGTLTGGVTKTSKGPTPLGTWTLGTTAGLQTLHVQAGSVSIDISANATAAAAASSSSASGPQTAGGAVGAVSVLQPSIKLLDAFGNPVAGVAITVQITGGGRVSNPTPVTGNDGIASAGTWTLGTVAGQQTVTLSGGGTAPAVVFTATVSAGPAASASATSATSLNGAPSTVAPVSPSIKVVDAFGNGVGAVLVQLTLGAASGTVSNPNPVTDVNGVASAGVWTFGAGTGTQTLTMAVAGFPPVVFTATITVGFNVTVRFFGGTPEPAVQSAVLSAASRLQQIVAGDLPDQPINAIVSGCAPGAPPINEVIDDIVIYVRVTSIDGPLGILADAGPCGPTRLASPFLPFIGEMDIDEADVTFMLNNGLTNNVILHEMMHALGFGTMWAPSSVAPSVPNLLQGSGTLNPIFMGPLARAAYLSAGGTSVAGVPVENTGGTGTAGSHWRQTVFSNELMTGTISAGARPLSAVTITSLADLGYAVNVAAADPFTVTPPGQLRAGVQSPVFSLVERTFAPRQLRDASGQIMMVAPPALPPRGR